MKIGDKVQINLSCPLKGLIAYNFKRGEIIEISRSGIHRFIKVKFNIDEIVEFPTAFLRNLD